MPLIFSHNAVSTDSMLPSDRLRWSTESDETFRRELRQNSKNIVSMRWMRQLEIELIIISKHTTCTASLSAMPIPPTFAKSAVPIAFHLDVLIGWEEIKTALYGCAAETFSMRNPVLPPTSGLVLNGRNRSFLSPDPLTPGIRPKEIKVLLPRL